MASYTAYRLSLGHQGPDPDIPGESREIDLGVQPEQAVVDLMAAIKTVPYWNLLSCFKTTTDQVHSSWNDATEEFEVQE